MARKATAARSRNPDISTEYSRERYAHPFFLPAPPEARTPINGHTRMTQWSMNGLGPLPPVKGNGVMELADIIGAQGVAEVEQLGEIRFHALGDSGVNHATRAEEVAEDMATDFKAGAGAVNPSFLFHLGDIVYGPGKDEHYIERFYRPYRHYPGKILAIPGNHDGESISPADNPSLKSYLANFCAKTAAVPTEVANIGIFRETMTQPGAYWMLDAPFVRIIGLYSNRLENPGFLEGDGGNDKSQLTWLAATLKSIAKNKKKKALIIAAHHPPFSSAGHEGSTKMMESIDALCQAAGLFPDAFLSAHAHNYQRYTRRMAGKQIPYIVCGTGGISPQKVPDAAGEPVEGSPGTTYDGAMKSYGYLYVTASPHSLKFEFWPLTDGGHAAAFDPITVNLDTHVVSKG